MDHGTTVKFAAMGSGAWLALTLGLALITGAIHAYIGIADLLDGTGNQGVAFIMMAIP